MDTPIEQKPLYLEVAGRLRERIYAQRLKPGEWIDETAMSKELGISRTPLREALKVLHAESLVELVPRRGCYVKTLDGDGLHELFPVMATLEGLCARLAVEHCTPEPGRRRSKRLSPRLCRPTTDPQCLLNQGRPMAALFCVRLFGHQHGEGFQSLHVIRLVKTLTVLMS